LHIASANDKADHEKAYFIERDWKQEFASDVHEFTLNEFGNHVNNFVKAAFEFSKASGIVSKDLHEFLRVALEPAAKPRLKANRNDWSISQRLDRVLPTK
jgi:hypothetical protein